MTDKGVVLLQDSLDSQKDEPGSHSEACASSSLNGVQAVNIKVEESSDMEGGEDPVPMTVVGIKAEHEEDVPSSHSEAFSSLSLNGVQAVDMKFEEFLDIEDSKDAVPMTIVGLKTEHEMEPQKRARYSKLLNAEELEEILMEEESYEELEDISDFIEPRENMSSSSSSSSSSSDKEAEEMEIRFRDRRPGDLPKVLDFTGPPSGINRSAAPNISAQSSLFSIFILFFQQIFQILLQETNRYFHQFMACQDGPGPSVQPPDITIEDIYIYILLFGNNN
ncbi:hypothetical protein B7P43_G17893 [Cryptotermes secundus]|uniref:Uncharacterized protein n=1 Tax=Cryptotermes secundus TaxID=105785 RepID=A0A2J7QVL7_9NEOP|nr:hypothetical protein B7P43_G17893 [Cryptotermes secundus]